MQRKLIRNLTVFAVVFLVSFNALSFRVAASPRSSYYYKFIVDTEGFTEVEVNFSSTDASGSSWVLVPKFSKWNYSRTAGSITSSENVSTTSVGIEDLYFYQAFKFSYQASAGSFGLTIRFGFSNGALIVEARGIFFSPQIGYQPSSSGKAEVVLNENFQINQENAIAVGSRDYAMSTVDPHRALLDPVPENLLRLQVEFATNLSSPSTTLTSQNGVFKFNSPNRYENYSSNILKLYDRLYINYTRLFNVTLNPPINVQFFLPRFEEFLTLGGFTPFSGTVAGTININIFFIRTVNGTIEVIAAHELVHHFLIRAGLSPNNFLWLHEGMSQYISVSFVDQLGYEGARLERERLEQSASALVRLPGGEKFGFIQNWSPSASTTNVGNYYIASYYVVSRLAQDYGGSDYYKRFFELINGVKVDSIEVLTLYLSQAANASVALTLQGWGFSVFDLYTSEDIRERIVETQKIIAATNPLLQPYKSLAEFFYRQALVSFRRGDMEGGASYLQLANLMAELAPLLTLLTIAAILGVIAYVLHRRGEKAKLKPAAPRLPPPPPEIFPQI